jgi:hypothetical protein
MHKREINKNDKNIVKFIESSFIIWYFLSAALVKKVSCKIE